MLLPFLQGSALESAHRGARPVVTVGEESARNLGGFNS
jgi:hypothetical protein